MNAIAMLERCGKHQITEYGWEAPPSYLTPEQPWREQETLSDPERSEAPLDA